jgi:hypothetical protein
MIVDFYVEGSRSFREAARGVANNFTLRMTRIWNQICFSSCDVGIRFCVAFPILLSDEPFTLFLFKNNSSFRS